MQSNETLIEQAISERWINSLAVFYSIKCKYKNSSIYNYSSRTLAEKLDINHNAINKHIRVLKQKGLIKQYSANITLISTKAKHKCTLNINKESSQEEIRNELRFKILEQNFRRQKYVIDKKNEARNLEAKESKPKAIFSAKEYRKLRKVRRDKSMLESSVNYNEVSLSDKSFGEILNISKRLVTKLKKFWQKTGKILYKSGYCRLRKYYKGFELESNQFFFKGYVYQSSITEYRLIVKY